MKVLVMANTFGADLWSFAKFLDRQPGVDLKIVLNDPPSFRHEGVAQLFPLQAELMDRRWYHGFVGPLLYKPDLTIMDNSPPALRAPSPYALMLWHGFGWKGPNDLEEFKYLHLKLRKAWGDAQKPNRRFRWQCFGPWDFEHRTKVSGFHPDNCRILGAASHDDLRAPLDRSLAQPFYPFDVVNRKTVLIAPTWHYGEVFAHWGTDAVLFGRLFSHITRRHNANVILRLHDSFRFERAYVRSLKKLTYSYPNVMLKFKDKAPDNFLDMQVSDALITNFSSIANLYYATRRPTIHVYPVRSADEEFMWRTYTLAGVRKRKIDSVRYIWKLPPEENGGLLAHSFDELIAGVDQAMDDPHCCEDAAQAFLDKYMLGADGKSCERIWETVQELVEQPVAAQ
jgi:hypothetical protein